MPIPVLFVGGYIYIYRFVSVTVAVPIVVCIIPGMYEYEVT